MIERGSFTISGGEFDARIAPSDWRFSAAIVGMVRYFETHGMNYARDPHHLYYNYENLIDDEAYAMYVESNYPSLMYHREIEQLLEEEELSDEKLKRIKELMVANASMKKYFKGLEASENENLQKVISENRQILILESFKNAKSGYAKFANTFRFRTEKGKICRLNGYYEDTGRKTKALGFSFNDQARSYQDAIEFDFIPFAFTPNREAVFVNDNSTIESLVKANNSLAGEISQANQDPGVANSGKENFRSMIFYHMKGSSIYLNYDVEIILKDMDKDYFEVMFIRQESIRIFEQIR